MSMKIELWGGPFDGATRVIEGGRFLSLPFMDFCPGSNLFGDHRYENTGEDNNGLTRFAYVGKIPHPTETPNG